MAAGSTSATSLLQVGLLQGRPTRHGAYEHQEEVAKRPSCQAHTEARSAHLRLSLHPFADASGVHDEYIVYEVASSITPTWVYQDVRQRYA